MEPAAFNADISKRFRWAAAALIVGVALLRVIYLGWFCPLEMAPDEAHYWDWSRHLDWCYYSKGPLVAWLIRLSCEVIGPFSHALTGSDMLAVRFPAVVCGSLLLVGLYALTVQVYQSDRLGFAVVALALTLPIVAAGSSLMTIDAPFICAWMWALVFVQRAVFGAACWAWPAAGVCVLLGVLTKHTMVLFVPSLALFLVATPSLRCQLRETGFWWMTLIGALGGVPILVWNALNGWVSLTHTQTHAGFEGETAIHWLGPLHYLGGQFAILLGFWFIVWARAMWAHRPTREARPELTFLWWMSAPTFVFFALFCVKNGGGEANWPLAGYLAGMVLAADWLRRELCHPLAWYRRFAKASLACVAALGLIVTAIAHEPISMQPVFLRLAGPATDRHPLPMRRVDPTSRLRGWRFLAREVDRTLVELNARGIDPVIATERWTQASELRFYGEGHPSVHCLGLLYGDRESQYDLWRPNPIKDAEAFRGRSFLIVSSGTEPLAQAFASLEPVRVITYRENGHPIAAWMITVAHGYGCARGFRHQGLTQRRKDAKEK